MASIKFHLIHIEELAKKALEEEKLQTKLLIVVAGLIVVNILVQILAAIS
jgi:hypothetical protein